MVLVLAGCFDISGKFRPGSFGNTKEEVAMLESLTEKYGNLAEKGGAPRFLEVMMTTYVENHIPRDSVSKYIQDTEELYVWFVYDNFDNDTLEIEWIYLDDNHTIHIFESQTGENFGRGTFVLEQPEDGWPTGNYKVIIRGGGIETSIPFEIISENMVSIPLEMGDGKITLPESSQTVGTEPTVSDNKMGEEGTASSTDPGWYLVREMPIMSNNDITIHPDGGPGSTHSGDRYTDVHRGNIDKPIYDFIIERLFEQGDISASGSVRITWEDPSSYLAPGQKASISAEVEMIHSWAVGNMVASFDEVDVQPGYSSPSVIRFVTPEGKNIARGASYSGNIQMVKEIPEGKPGDERAILINFGNGYGYRYIYQWRE